AELLLGLGIGCAMVPATSTATSGVDPREAGVASATLNTAQQIGASLGTALLNTLAAATSLAYASANPAATVAERLVHGYAAASVAGAAAPILGTVTTQEAGPMPLTSVLTYTLIAEVFAEQLNLRTTLNDAFWEGTLVMRFLRPMGLVTQLGAEMLGRWMIDFALFSLPLMAFAPLFGVDPRPANLTSAVLFVVSLSM